VLLDHILFFSDMRDGKVRVYSMRPDGTELAQLTNGWPYTRAEERDSYTADRSLRAFALREGQFGTRGKIQLFYNFYEYDTVPQLTFFGAGTAWAPAWSPTEQKVAFVSNESRNDEIWVAERDQWPAIQLTFNDWAWDHHPSWSPDGTQIVFSSNRSGKRQLWIMDANGDNQQPLTPFEYEAWDPVWVKYPDT
jgi:TolB protein